MAALDLSQELPTLSVHIRNIGKTLSPPDPQVHLDRFSFPGEELHLGNGSPAIVPAHGTQ